MRATLALALLGVNWHSASRPALVAAGAQPPPPEVIGLASGALDCLTPAQPAGQLTVNWSGHAERARLILWVAGAEAPHSILINGQAVATAPVVPGGEPCSGEPFYLDIPPEALLLGPNTVEITNDQLPGDAWTASQVRLEVFGHWQAQTTPTLGVSTAAAISLTVPIANSYDGSTQEAWVQVPDGYDSGVPTPLVIYVHGRSSDMYEPAAAGNEFDAAADSRGWLLASPQLHGRWPGTAADPIPSPPGKYAYASLESQYDIIGTLKYMLDHYNVKRNQVYLVGNSMGGQTVTVVAAKFPHLFAAVYDVKGPTDFAQWHGESDGFHRAWMERECFAGSPANPQRQTPVENPFCYQRRSSQSFASNYLHVPISITHSLSDTLVPIGHSFELRDAINSYSPDQAASVLVDTVVGPACGAPYHCYDPAWPAVLQFLAQHTLNNVPLRLHIASDESKPYYWLSLSQSGGSHWSQVAATASPGLSTVTLDVTDPQPLTLRLNLGAGSIVGDAGISQPGLGFAPGPYRVQGLGLNTIINYSSGYLTLNLPAANHGTVTISPASTTLLRLFLPLIRR